MGKAYQNFIALMWACAIFQFLITSADAQLTPNFYANTCPKLHSVVKQSVGSAIRNEARIAASLLRVHFHDCFVQGCDASVLLDGSGTEKLAPPNMNSLRGFEVIDSIKAAVEKACPNVVSCADILALSAFYGVVLNGGPSWLLPLGRRDSLAPNFNLTSNLPSPNANFVTLKDKFAVQNLDITDLVALSGGHTVGFARCVTLWTRLYNFSSSGSSDPSVDKTLLATLEQRCPFGVNGDVLNFLDLSTPTKFDNSYFRNIMASKSLFSSDQLLLTATAETRALVRQYAYDQRKFFSAFAKSMVKMGNLNPLTGKAGQIRANCRAANPTGTVTTTKSDIQS